MNSRNKLTKSTNKTSSNANKLNGKIEKVDINQRRYLGNKHSLIDFIKSVVEREIGEFKSFCDIFAGTGVVGASFNHKERKIILNENLYSNFIPLKAWFSSQSFRKDLIKDMIKEFQKIESEEENYVSKHFGGRYFSKKVARKIGFIRKKIEEIESKYHLNSREKNILLTSLFYAFDRIANTCGHYDAYRGKPSGDKNLKLRLPNVFSEEENQKNEVFLENANELVQEIKVDVLYLDPPYNSRQYCDMYHLPENILSWEKPSVEGKAKKFDRKELKSDYNRKEASKAFRDLIEKAKCNHILLSYNNMGEKGDSRSNAKIPDDVIKNTLSEKGELEIFTQDYKHFNAGKRDIKDHKERLFLCKVK